MPERALAPGPSWSRRRERLPWLSALVVAAAILVSLSPGVVERLEYRREVTARGELWRPLTGQLTHWSARMIAADLGVLLLAASWVELRSRALAAMTLVAAACAVGLGVVLDPTIAAYRGSSGMATAAFVVAALQLGVSDPGGRSRLAAIAVLALLACKLIWEAWTGEALAAGPLPAGVRVLARVHLLGALAGALVFGLFAARAAAPASR